LQLARQKDEAAMLQLLEKVEAGNLGRQDVRELRKKDAARRPGRPAGFTFKYQAPDKAFRLQIRFGRASVDKPELIRTLQQILHSLQQN
jgi:hypothetical protein